jgi:hypothetical protein
MFQSADPLQTHPEAKQLLTPKKKQKKRPRDRILRDHNISRQVLELRKKGAFLGYTYLKPKGKENQSAVKASGRSKAPVVS